MLARHQQMGPRSHVLGHCMLGAEQTVTTPLCLRRGHAVASHTLHQRQETKHEPVGSKRSLNGIKKLLNVLLFSEAT